MGASSTLRLASRKTVRPNEYHEAHHDDGSRSIAVQTLYRESEAQTDPYSPEYVLDPNARTPDILKLTFLKANGENGKSLPAGKEEIEAIEVTLSRAQIENSLPPMTDEASMFVRTYLLEGLEIGAVVDRDAALEEEKEDRLMVVEAALRARAEQRDSIARQRVEALRLHLEAQTDHTLRKLAQKRLKTVRKLDKQRTEVEKHVDLLTGTGEFAGLFSATNAAQSTTGTALQNSALGGLSRSTNFLANASSTAPAGGSAVRVIRKVRQTRDIIAEFADYGSTVYVSNRKDGLARVNPTRNAKNDVTRLSGTRLKASAAKISNTLPTELAMETVNAQTFSVLGQNALTTAAAVVAAANIAEIPGSSAADLPELRGDADALAELHESIHPSLLEVSLETDREDSRAHTIQRKSSATLQRDLEKVYNVIQKHKEQVKAKEIELATSGFVRTESKTIEQLVDEAKKDGIPSWRLPKITVNRPSTPDFSHPSDEPTVAEQVYASFSNTRGLHGILGMDVPAFTLGPTHPAGESFLHSTTAAAQSAPLGSPSNALGSSSSASLSPSHGQTQGSGGTSASHTDDPNAAMAGHSSAAAAGTTYAPAANSSGGTWRADYGAPPPVPVANLPLGHTDAEAAVLILQSLLRGRSVEFAMKAGKAGRLDLIKEMRLSYSAVFDSGSPTSSLQDPDGDLARRREVQTEEELRERAEETVGSIAAGTLHTLTSEFFRQRELERIQALAQRATEERRRREQREREMRAEEFRQAEIARRQRETRERIVTSMAEGLLTHAVSRAIVTFANEQAREATQLPVGSVSELVLALEQRTDVLAERLGLPTSIHAGTIGFSSEILAHQIEAAVDSERERKGEIAAALQPPSIESDALGFGDVATLRLESLSLQGDEDGTANPSPHRSSPALGKKVNNAPRDQDMDVTDFFREKKDQEVDGDDDGSGNSWAPTALHIQRPSLAPATSTPDSLRAVPPNAHTPSSLFLSPLAHQSYTPSSSDATTDRVPVETPLVGLELLEHHTGLVAPISDVSSASAAGYSSFSEVSAVTPLSVPLSGALEAGVALDALDSSSILPSETELSPSKNGEEVVLQGAEDAMETVPSPTLDLTNDLNLSLHSPTLAPLGDTQQFMANNDMVLSPDTLISPNPKVFRAPTLRKDESGNTLAIGVPGDDVSYSEMNGEFDNGEFASDYNLLGSLALDSLPNEMGMSTLFEDSGAISAAEASFAHNDASTLNSTGLYMTYSPEQSASLVDLSPEGSADEQE